MSKDTTTSLVAGRACHSEGRGRDVPAVVAAVRKGRRSRAALRLGALAPVCLALALAFSASAFATTTVRIEDIATVYGTAGHELVGYGLVVGLNGTGDSNRTIFTARSLSNMLERFGVTVDAGSIRADNVAAVMATAELPSEALEGTKLDVTVSSLGDAKSLQGGTLIVTPLEAGDGQVYAVAQGPVSIGGFSASAGGSSTQKNHPLVARVPNGASVVRPLTSQVVTGRTVTILLHDPDFTTSLRVAEAVNSGLGDGLARAVNQAVVEVRVPEEYAGDLVEFVSRVEGLTVQPDLPARVVINERTGTVVISGNVRILPCAIAHGGLTVQIKTQWDVSQPPPAVVGGGAAQQQQSTTVVAPAAPVGRQTAGSAPAGGPGGAAGTTGGQGPAAPAGRGAEPRGLPASLQKGPLEPTPSAPLPQPASLTGAQTVVVPQTKVKAQEAGGQLYAVPEQATLQDLVRALNTLGVTPRDLIAILQALKQMGALEGEVVIQ